MDIPHKNMDSVFKDSMVLFKDKALEFLGISNIAPITEHLGTESVQVEVTWEFMDLAFATKDGRGLHLEEEINLSKDDLLRFCSYNISLSRAHNREFVSVIFVKNPTELTEIRTEQLQFKPIIVHCSKIDADEILERLKEATSAGVPINELEAIYLPLFHSNRLTPTELFLESAGLVQAMQADDDHKRKVLALLVTLAGKVVDRNQLDLLVEEVVKMGNVIIEYFEERGETRGLRRKQEETALKMIEKGYDSLEIVDITGISIERIRKLREAVSDEAV